MLSNRVGNRICGLVCAGTLLAGLGNAPASAQIADERTFFTFSGPVELPGIALAAGTYMFRLIAPNDDHSYDSTGFEFIYPRGQAARGTTVAGASARATHSQASTTAADPASDAEPANGN